jgi:hypothetical protein
MPTWWGPQGIGKSRLLRIMAVRDEWFSDYFPWNDNPARIIEATRGKWIIESSDLAGMTRNSDLQHQKSRPITAIRSRTVGICSLCIRGAKAIRCVWHDERREIFAQSKPDFLARPRKKKPGSVPGEGPPLPGGRVEVGGKFTATMQISWRCRR